MISFINHITGYALPKNCYSLRSLRRFAVLDKPSATQSNGIGVKEALAFHVKDTLVKTFGDIVLDADPMIAPAGKPEFGDYQCNAAMG